MIEHSFVTTMPSQQALTAASDMLGKGGFVAEAQKGFRLGEGDWTSLQMKRGRRTVSRAKDPTECPQRIRLDWDRGRVTLAASIEPKVVRRSFFYGGILGWGITAAHSSSVFGSRRSKKTIKDYSDLMILIATGVEDLLARRATPEVASQQWFAFQDQLKQQARKTRRRSLIFLGIFLALIIAMVVFSIGHRTF